MSDLMHPRQVAAYLGVRQALLAEWADAGLIACTRTPGGHRRYDPEVVAAFTPPGDRRKPRALFVMETTDGAVRVRGHAAMGAPAMAALARTVLAAQALLDHQPTTEGDRP